MNKRILRSIISVSLLVCSAAPGLADTVKYEYDALGRLEEADSLQIIQRGNDSAHFEITPKPGANLTPAQFQNALDCIERKR